MHKTRVLTICCYAGSGEEVVMEDVKRDSVYIKWMDTYIKKEYLHPVVMQEVVKKVSWRT